MSGKERQSGYNEDAKAAKGVQAGIHTAAQGASDASSLGDKTDSERPPEKEIDVHSAFSYFLLFLLFLGVVLILL